jgi:hypothetical protein
MTLAHQCQITQLKDSFKEKLKQNTDWQDKVAAELNKEREKFNLEMEKLEASLRENFKMVLINLIISLKDYFFTIKNYPQKRTLIFNNKNIMKCT